MSEQLDRIFQLALDPYLPFYIIYELSTWFCVGLVILVLI